MRIELRTDLSSIAAGAWDALAGDQPFLSHAFLSALARHGAVGGDSGWHPRYLVARDGDRLVGALPMFMKDHSFGEFVFDWAWAEAYHRNGLRYYPKLVVAVPYTPVTGARILLAPDCDTGAVSAALIEAALAHAGESRASSLHWLFTSAEDDERLRARGFMARSGCQFHWRNRGFDGFDDFLATLSSRHRKKIRAERDGVAERGVRTEVRTGDTVPPELWDVFHGFYLSTFERKGNYAPLTREFFRDIGAALGDRTVLTLAERGGSYIAGAFFFVGGDTLYGRNWGRSEEVPGLHFELCYYRAIEYCIERGLRRFEAGAQGEYKVKRGFEPVETRSAHWIADERFAAAIGDFLRRERGAMGDYMAGMAEHLPYRNAHAGD